MSTGNSDAYDANGNQVSLVIGLDTYSLSYDAENRLTTVLKNVQPLAAFTYDGDSKQVSATVNGVQTKYVNGVYEVEGVNVTKYYLAGLNRVAMRVNGVLNYLVQDHLGSTALVTDNLGNVVSEQRYKAWGETRYSSSTANTDYLYTGQREVADIGLYFYNARWYDSNLGRFVQADSIVPGAGDPWAWDKYSYVKNSPVIYNDPSGHKPCWATAKYSCNLNTEDLSTLLSSGNSDYINFASNYFHGQIQISFQLFPVFDSFYYRESAELSYTGYNFSGVSNASSTIMSLMDGLSLINDILIGYRSTYYRKYTAYDQILTLGYELSYQGIPKVNATRTVSLTSLEITNNSDILQLISYRIFINSKNGAIEELLSAGPGQNSISLINPIVITTEGIEFFVKAFSGCIGACISGIDDQEYIGYLNFILKP